MNRFYGIIRNLFLCMSLIFILSCDSNPASSDTENKGWISFQLDGISHKYEKGMYDESYPDKSLLSREAYTYYLPADFAGSGNDPQYVFLAFESLVTNVQQAQNGLTMSIYNDYDTVWKLGIAYFDENGVLSQSDNVKLDTMPIDTTITVGERMSGEISGSYLLSSSGKTISNIEYSVIRIK